MAKAMRGVVCKHCKRRDDGKAVLVGLSIICPYCKKPIE